MAVVKSVFVSSTSKDLYYHRAAVQDILQRLGYRVIMMEHFGARNEDATEISLAKVREGDLYLLLVAWRYGHIPSGATYSITHQEYEEAVHLHKDRLIFMADPATESLIRSVDLFPAATRDLEHHDQLLAFREHLLNDAKRVVDFFTSPDDLAKRVAASMLQFVPLIPFHWVAMTPDGFLGRQADVTVIVTHLLEGRSTAIVGMGGLGKTVLARHILDRCAERHETFGNRILFRKMQGLMHLAGLIDLYEQIAHMWNIVLAQSTISDTVERIAARYEDDIRHQLSGVSAGLLCLDNIEPDFPIARALELFHDCGVVVLLTCRHDPSLMPLVLHHLPLLPESESHALFQQRYRKETDRPLASSDDALVATIIHAVGQLPLAVEMFAALAARQQQPLAAFVQDFAGTSVLSLRTQPGDPTTSIRSILARSLATLDEETRLGFTLIGSLHGEEWSRSLLIALIEAMIPTATGTQFITMLQNYALLDFRSDPQGGEAQIHLHPLLHQLARESWLQLDEHTRAQQQLAVLHAYFTFMLSDPLPARVERDSQSLLASIRAHLDDVPVATEVLWLIDMLDWYFNQSGRWRIGYEFNERYLTFAQNTQNRFAEARAHMNIGQMALNRYDWENARTHFDASLVIVRDLKDKKMEARLLHNLGLLELSLNHDQVAAALFNDSLTLKQAIGDTTRLSTTFNTIGQLAEKQGRADLAREYYFRSLAQARLLKDDKAVTMAQFRLGHLAAKQGNHEAGCRIFEQVIPLFQQVGNKPFLIHALRELSQSEHALGQTNAAKNHFIQALEIAHTFEDSSFSIMLLVDLYRFSADIGQVTEALSYLEQAGQLGIQEPELIRRHQAMLPTLKVEESVAHAQQLTDIAHIAGNLQFELESLNMTACMLRDNLHFADALKPIRQGIVLAQQYQDFTKLGELLNLEGQVYEALRQYKRAKQSYEKAAVAAQTAGDELEQGYIEYNRGVMELHRGFLLKAHIHFKQAWELFTMVGSTQDAADANALLHRIIHTRQSKRRCSVLSLYHHLRSDWRLV